MQCGRCNQQVAGFTFSYFNEDLICMGCRRVERAHPKWAEACEKEFEEVQKGNLNFPGIGLPEDLKPIKL